VEKVQEQQPDWNKLLRGFNVIEEEYCMYRANDAGEEVEITVVLAGNGFPYKRGRTWGPAEHCYPSEGGYCEDVTAFDSKTGERLDLTKDEDETAQEYLWNKFCDMDEPGEDEPYDDDDDEPYEPYDD
jgi:hypothetical protein